MAVKPEDIREVEATVKKYIWICPMCGIERGVQSRCRGENVKNDQRARERVSNKS